MAFDTDADGGNNFYTVNGKSFYYAKYPIIVKRSEPVRIYLANLTEFDLIKALRHGVTLVNAPGTIDSDYRGEVKVLLINLGREAFTVERGDRIAQIVFAPVARLELEERTALGETDRSTGGFGSTGIRD